MPVILYNIPSRTVINMPPDLLAELAQIDNVVAVKQANDDELGPIEGLDVLAGNDDIFFRTLELGGAGGICVASHLVGNEMREMYDAAKAGDLDRAREIDTKLQPFYEALAVTTNPIPVKAGLELLGVCSARARLPIVEADDEQRRDGQVRGGARASGCPTTATSESPLVKLEMRILPLGGLGEIGKNMTVIESDGRIVIVDTGLMFPTAEMLGIDLVLPDFSTCASAPTTSRRSSSPTATRTTSAPCPTCCARSASRR